MKTSSFTFATPTGFALSAASEFYAGFTPGSGMAVADPRQLTLAFRLDRSFAAVAVALAHEGDRIRAHYTGTDDEATLQKQVARMLGLDVDVDAGAGAEADDWWALGQREPAVGALQAEFPGFFTAAKASPYDAAAWGIISPRMQMAQAARIKMRLGEQYGDVVILDDRKHSVFPSPQQLQRIDEVPGLSKEKLARLQGIGLAAMQGKLDADVLRAMDERDALAALQELPGVGPWTASHILYRGCAVRDALPTAEPRVLHGLAAAYGLKDTPTVDEYLAIGARWKPFRMWVCVLLARHLGRVGGWHKAGLKEERAAAGKRVRLRA
jgi:DNA-3-methyladenine glycosylase II